MKVEERLETIEEGWKAPPEIPICYNCKSKLKQSEIDFCSINTEYFNNKKYCIPCQIKTAKNKIINI